MSSTRAFVIGLLILATAFPPQAAADDEGLEPAAGTTIDPERLRLDMAVGAERFDIELDLPSYLRGELPPVNKWLAGRSLLIVAQDAAVTRPIGAIRLERRERATLKLLGALPAAAEPRGDGFAVKLPIEAEGGLYLLRFELPDGPAVLPIEVHALDLPEATPETKKSSTADAIVSHINRLGCGFCFWESVLMTHPDNEDFGYLAGGGGSDYLIQTTDAWESNTVLSINELTDPRTTFFRGDPKLEMTAGGELALTSLMSVPDQQPITGGFYRDRAPMNVPPDFEQTLLSPIPPDLPPETVLIFDYPKIAIDKELDSPFVGSIYIFANGVYFDGSHDAGFYTIRDGSVALQRGSDLGFVQPQSAVVGPGGNLYQARNAGPLKIFYRSSDGGVSFTESLIVSTGEPPVCGPARVSSTSTQSWNLAQGPELAIDHDSGRIHAIWAQYLECVEDAALEFPFYSRDYDVYTAFSDDRGATWSAPLRVNDDTGGGDQGFPDIAVDQDGTVYVAFLDHRSRQDQPLFDVYFAMSTDHGASFSRNVKINDLPVPNVVGGRDPGDYLDMIGIGPSKVFIAHPCVDESGGNDFRPTDACIAILPKPITIPGPTDPCVPGEQIACLLGAKFRVEGIMATFDVPPASFPTRVMAFEGGRAESDQAVFFESFEAGNFEVGVKMVDACGLDPSHPLRAYWAFFGALSNAETRLTIRDTVTDARYEWSNAAGEFPRSLGDTRAFPCAEGAAAAPCIRGEERACLLSGRFQVEGIMEDFALPPATYPTRVMTFPGDGRAESDQAVFFESFEAGNFEVGVKMVDACSLPEDNPLRAYWVFYGALSNAETQIEVTQTTTGLVDRWSNPAGLFPLTEGRTNAFPCESP